MRGYEVGKEIKAKAPPYSAKDVTCDLLHSSHKVYAVIDLREELEQKDQQKNCHY